jgi:hypothetical protein
MIADKHGGKLDVSGKFRLFVARCDKDLSFNFKICQPGGHHCVSSSAIQRHFYAPMARLKIGQLEQLRLGRRNLRFCSDLSCSIF